MEYQAEHGCLAQVCQRQGVHRGVDRLLQERLRDDKTSKASAADGLQIRLSDRKHFGATLLFPTGSAAHVEQLEALAAEKGMQLEADGLHKGRTLIAGDEAEIYRALGLPCFDPELREDRGELASSSTRPTSTRAT
ncbi:hypothetical protein [Bradyrhizobium sp. I1.8.5]|uniref:hypothetical protein n=1 Tax=Bradyrhizobium sp. I1.8.5 TaxID=3156365 RepID=UPI00339620BF